MASRQKRTIKGIEAELEVQLEFTKDPNLIVFTPLMGLGLVDIVTLNRETGEFKAYDVKSRRLGIEIIYPKERNES